MDLRIALEWDEGTGISLSKMYPLREGVEESFKNKSYGKSTSTMWIVLICRPYNFKQRKRFKKDVGRFEYDILLDYFLIKNADLGEKKNIIRKQIVEITELTFSKYKLDDFDKSAFLNDLKEIVNSITW